MRQEEEKPHHLPSCRPLIYLPRPPCPTHSVGFVAATVAAPGARLVHETSAAIGWPTHAYAQRGHPTHPSARQKWSIWPVWRIAGTKRFCTAARAWSHRLRLENARRNDLRVSDRSKDAPRKRNGEVSAGVSGRSSVCRSWFMSFAVQLLA